MARGGKRWDYICKRYGSDYIHKDMKYISKDTDPITISKDMNLITLSFVIWDRFSSLGRLSANFLFNKIFCLSIKKKISDKQVEVI